MSVRSSSDETVYRMLRGESRTLADHRWSNDDIWATCRALDGAEAELHHVADWHVFVLTRQGGTVLTGARVAGSPVYEGADKPGLISYLPAGADRHSWYVGANLKTIGLLFKDCVARKLGVDDLLRNTRPVVNGADPVVATLLASLAEEIETDAAPATIYLEHLVGVLAGRLTSLARETVRPRHTLGRRKVRMITEYVDAHLTGELSVADLAAIAEMSAESFARHFKASTGKTPYQYVLDCRVRRAEQLLRETDQGLAYLALQAGFSSQSHLTSAFKKARGITPAAYRVQSQRA